MFETDSYCSTYTMADLEHNNILTDKCAIHFFELPKLDNNYSSEDKKKLWMQLINSESEGELDMLAKTNVPEITNAVMVIRELSADERIKEFARRREDALREELSALDYASRTGRAEGRAEGLSEGIEKGRNMMIENMRLAGIPQEQIDKVILMNS